MRMHMNSPLMAAKAKLGVAIASLTREHEHTNHPTHPSDDLSIQNAKDGLNFAITEFVRRPAHNGCEILLKLEELFDHTLEWRENSEAIQRDLIEAARPQPSAAMVTSFSAFRASWIALADQDASTTSTTDDECRLVDAMSAALAAVFSVNCATAGDFVVKAYANLLWHAGHTASQHLPDHDTGSYFDISLSEIDSDSVVTDAYYRSVYDDLDHSDLGACLLATGNIDFDPLGWVERAGAIGMPVSVIIRADGVKSMNFGFIDSNDDRLHREERRLQQLLTFDSAHRWKAVADYIAEHRGDLVYTAAASAKSEPYRAFHDEDMQESAQ